MSETCIICLGDLGDVANDSPLLTTAPSPSQQQHETKPADVNSKNSAKLIAHIIPCGHSLHDECLKPWVKQANSCPICRQVFNVVELLDGVGGSVRSAYSVDDKIQQAEIDPLMLAQLQEPEEEKCPICGASDNEDELLLCDGCETGFHTYCIGLDSLPVDEWFCEGCDSQEALNIASRLERTPRPQVRRRVRRYRQDVPQWARLWQQVWDHLNIDLDFPFDDEDGPLPSRRRAGVDEPQYSQDYEALQRRLRVAERSGFGVTFRNAALHGLRRPQSHRPRPPTPEPESQEALHAWNAFEKSQQIETNSNRRKRKSTTSSPAEPSAPDQPERKLKRPRTRRNEDLADAAESAAESSTTRSRRLSPRAVNERSVENNLSSAPSFLQSLLKEVEDSSSADNGRTAFRTPVMAAAATSSGGLSSPQPSSPVLSPHASNHSSPRATSSTPPPPPPPGNLSLRPSSPTPLTSRIEPDFSAPEFSPSRSPTERMGRSPTLQPRPLSNTRVPVWLEGTLPPNSRPRSAESSPTRAELSLSVKTGVQKVVSNALKPYYRNQEVSKDQFTDINRSISRKLYDRIGELGALNSENQDGWEKVANEEVSRAIEALKS